LGSCPAVHESGDDLARHAASDDSPIPRPLLESAQRVHSRMAESQSRPRLLHGDLHHYNVLRDEERGWLAIDPKGVFGEMEYEVGASLRNPYERPELFTDPSVIERRVNCFARVLHLDASRILAWAFAQAVLAAIWVVEDGGPIPLAHAWLVLADRIRPMLKGVVEA
jgi:streptomycin 6-kinase